MKLKNLFTILMGLVGLYTFVGFKPVKKTQFVKADNFKIPNQPSAAFYQKQCGFCHTSEELIAPDMNKIKAKYLEKFKTKEDFVNAVITFVKNPDKKNAIYTDGIDNFMDMPKMPFKESQIKAVAEYIYNTEKL